MCYVLGMDYYWFHVKSIYFVKVFDLEDLLSTKEGG
jgi:hypothetical protein